MVVVCIFVPLLAKPLCKPGPARNAPCPYPPIALQGDKHGKMILNLALISALLGAAIAAFILLLFLWPTSKTILPHTTLTDMAARRRRKKHFHAPCTKDCQPIVPVAIYRSELEYIRRCILDYPNIETGGQLFGFLTERGAPVVCYAIGPGPHANHQVAFFNQDIQYLQSLYTKLRDNWGLRYIGEWHSHHKLGLEHPSQHDEQTVRNGMRKSGFSNFLLCIGNCDDKAQTSLNPFAFNDRQAFGEYQQTSWEVKDIDSPYRQPIERQLQGILCHPGTNTIPKTQNTASSYPNGYWLNERQNNLVLKQIIDYLTNASQPQAAVKPQIDPHGLVRLTINYSQGQLHTTFGPRYPNDPPQIVAANGRALNTPNHWNFNGDILQAFKEYYHAALHNR